MIEPVQSSVHKQSGYHKCTLCSTDYLKHTVLIEKKNKTTCVDSNNIKIIESTI